MKEDDRFLGSVVAMVTVVGLFTSSYTERMAFSCYTKQTHMYMHICKYI